MKNKRYNTVETVSKSNLKIVVDVVDRHDISCAILSGAKLYSP